MQISGFPGSLRLIRFGSVNIRLTFLRISCGRVRYVNGVVVALAHLPPVDPQQLGDLGQHGLGDGEDLSVEMVEPPGHLAGELHVGDLVDPHGNLVGFVHDDVRGLQEGVPQKTVGRKVAVGELLLLILVGGNALQPGKRGDHGQEQVQLGMFLDLRLDKQNALFRGEPHAQPVDDLIPDVLLNDPGVGVLRRQGVPVGGKEETLVFLLEAFPIVQRTHQISQVKFSGRAHSA